MDRKLKNAFRKVLSENMTPNQTAAMSAGFGPVSVEYANTLASQGKITAQPNNTPWSVVQNSPTPQTPAQPTNTSVKFGVDYKFTYPGDNAYSYGYKDGKWYAKNISKNTEFDLSSNPKFKSSVDNLNKKFGSQVGSAQTQNTQQQPTNQPQSPYQFDFKQNLTAVDNTYVKPMVPPVLKEGVRRKTILESKYDVYHKSYTSAINAALDYANERGFEYDKEETAREIGLGPKKPSEGKTNRFSISLTKDGKEQKKKLQIQVYGMGEKYELNCYIN